MSDDRIERWLERVEGKLDAACTLTTRHDESLKAGYRRFEDHETRIRTLEGDTASLPDEPVMTVRGCDEKHKAQAEAQALAEEAKAKAPREAAADRRDVLRTGASIAQWIVALVALAVSAHVAGLF